MPKEIFKAIYKGLRLDGKNKLVEHWYRYDTEETLIFSKRRGTAPVIGISYPFEKGENGRYSVPGISNFLMGEDIVSVDNQTVAEWRDSEAIDKACLAGLQYKPSSEVADAIAVLKAYLKNKHYSQKKRTLSWLLKELL